MKKLFVMAAMVLSSVGAFAQYNAGDVTIQPKVGLNVSSLTEDDGRLRWRCRVGVSCITNVWYQRWSSLLYAGCKDKRHRCKGKDGLS